MALSQIHSRREEEGAHIIALRAADSQAVPGTARVREADVVGGTQTLSSALRGLSRWSSEETLQRRPFAAIGLSQRRHLKSSLAVESDWPEVFHEQEKPK
ncbi:hypothetical protein JZ751_002519, partial [Albula glossodonta]